LSCCGARRTEAPSKRIWGGTSDAPLGSSGGTPLLRSPRIQPWGFPRPRPNLPLGLPHSRAGFSSAQRARRKVFRRSKGGDWTEGLTRNRLEHSPLRRHYFMLALFPQTQREVSDETRSHHTRNCGHIGADRLGGGGECTIWRSGSSRPRLRSCTSLRPCASRWPFSKICPSSLPSLCSSELSRSELWRSPCGLLRRYGLHPWLWWAALCRYSSSICRTICPAE
jgi:hypothetical protein